MSLYPLLSVIFSTPLAAAAVAGGVAAVPVIIHLLNRKRFQIVSWAAMRFLLAAQRKNVRRLRLEQWLLLAVRMLVGSLIVAAMIAVMPWAEPLWQRVIPGAAVPAVSQGRTHWIIAIDGSFSMGARLDDDSTRFDLAKAQAQEVLKRFASGDGCSVVYLSSPAQVIVQGPADDRDKVGREIEELKLVHGSADVAGGLKLIADMVNRPLGVYSRRQVVFISDMKKSSWPLPLQDNQPMASDEAAAGLGAGIADSWRTIARSAHLAFIDVARLDVDNLAVTSVTLDDPLPLVNVSATVSAEVHNFGKVDRKNTPVELRIGQAPRAGEKFSFREAGQQLVNVRAGHSVTVKFALQNQTRFREPGEYILQVQAGDDALRLDDSRSLAIMVRETIPALVVNGKYSPIALETPGAVVAEALSPATPEKKSRDKSKLEGTPSRNPQSPVVVDLINTVQFADRFRSDLTKYDCVFLCDLPSIGGGEVERLEAHLRRGGSVVIGLGPNSIRNIEGYNRLLFNDGKGILPGRLLGARRAEGSNYFSLFAEEEAFKQPPLFGFHEDKARAALAMPQFHQYVRLDAPANGPARRILSFMPMTSAGKSDLPTGAGDARLDPAVVDFPRHRGHVIVFTTAFNAEPLGKEQFWSTWPSHPTFLPFLHETLYHAVAGGARRNLLAGESLDEYVPVNLTGLKAKLLYSEQDEVVDSAEITSRDDAALVHFGGLDRSGVYRVSIGSIPDALVAVNVPTTAEGGGAESDLRRLTPSELHSSAPEGDIQYVTSSGEIQLRSAPGANALQEAGRPEARGATVARFLLLIVLALIFAEVLLAWHYGSARATDVNSQPPPRRYRLFASLLWAVPIALCALVLLTLAHAVITDEFLGFLPGSWRASLEHSLGVPPAAPGEGTRWRLKAMSYLTGEGDIDRWLVAGLVIGALAFIAIIYRREQLGFVISPPRRFLKDPRVPPALLRIGLTLVALLVLLPQLQLAFEREGWPDIVVILDDSKSMGTVEPFHESPLRERTEELKRTWAELAAPRIAMLEKRLEQVRVGLNGPPSPTQDKLREEQTSLEKKLRNLRTPHRLNLIKALLVSSSRDWCRTLVRDRQMRVHLYRASDQAVRIVEFSDPAQCDRILEEIVDLTPEGEISRLGDALTTVLKTFRGGSLSAVIMLTDGNTPKEGDLPDSAWLAARMGVPLFFVGVGDNQPPPDISISDLMAERAMNVKDNLIMRFQLKAQGPGMPKEVPVHVFEIVDGKKVSRGETDRRYPVNQQVRIAVTPETPGDKKYVIEVPVQNGEIDAKNNRLEHEVHVDELKRVRVLMIEGTPRYEFRYLKSYLERESDKLAGNKSIELKVLLASANPEFAKQDRSAIAEFPSWEELKSFDVIILGDMDPKQLPREQAQVKMLADFVKERGGGFLMIAGEHFAPSAYAGTELADVLPITTDGIIQAPAPKADTPPIVETYSPRLTTIGQNHPIFRFVADDAENALIWGRLKEQFWFAKGYRRKPSAEVLAVHPRQPAEPWPGGGKEELHPLVLQQFVGSGRVMFFGFDETWRWRMRQDEPRFNQFWTQTIRSLARSRVGNVEIDVGRSTFRRDEPIKIVVRFPDDAPAPPPGEAIRVRIERRPLKAKGSEAALDDLDVQTMQLNPKEGTRATYEGLLTHTPEGEYRFLLANPVISGTKPKAEATVLPPKGELDDVQLKESNMQQAASRSHGAYYPLDRADKVLDDLPNNPRVALDQPCDPLLLWNHPLAFTLVFSLLVAEWILRKRARLL